MNVFMSVSNLCRPHHMCSGKYPEMGLTCLYDHKTIIAVNKSTKLRNIYNNTSIILYTPHVPFPYILLYITISVSMSNLKPITLVAAASLDLA